MNGLINMFPTPLPAQTKNKETVRVLGIRYSEGEPDTWFCLVVDAAGAMDWARYDFLKFPAGNVPAAGIWPPQ
jgi:hypothetical protein